jgi:hypothetical protein
MPAQRDGAAKQVKPILGALEIQGFPFRYL